MDEREERREGGGGKEREEEERREGGKDREGRVRVQNSLTRICTEPPLHTLSLLVTMSCVAKSPLQCHSTQLSRQLQIFFISPK